MQSVSRFVVRKLKLAVNEAKSSVSRPWQVRFLGFRITRNWAKALGNTRKGAWRISKHGSLYQALPESYFTQELGLFLLG